MQEILHLQVSSCIKVMLHDFGIILGWGGPNIPQGDAKLCQIIYLDMLKVK